jgi:dihydroxy-acid dehydratase
VPGVLRELMQAGKLHTDVMTVTGQTLAENLKTIPEPDREVIRAYDKPLKANAGYVVLTGNLFDNAVIKTSVIDEKFRQRFLADPAHPNRVDLKAVVFEGPEDYHARIEDPALGIDDKTILVIRNVGPVGYPGGPEVVNMQPPAALLAKGIDTLPTMGDGRQSGTSASPSILNVTPESAIGGGLALLKDGDVIRLDLNTCRVDILIPDEELAQRRAAWQPPKLVNQTPWEEIYRNTVGQHGTGACMEPATLYLNIIETRGEARDSH